MARIKNTARKSSIDVKKRDPTIGSLKSNPIIVHSTDSEDETKEPLTQKMDDEKEEPLAQIVDTLDKLTDADATEEEKTDGSEEEETDRSEEEGENGSSYDKLHEFMQDGHWINVNLKELIFKIREIMITEYLDVKCVMLLYTFLILQVNFLVGMIDTAARCFDNIGTCRYCEKELLRILPHTSVLFEMLTKMKSTFILNRRQFADDDHDQVVSDDVVTEIIGFLEKIIDVKNKIDTDLTLGTSIVKKCSC